MPNNAIDAIRERWLGASWIVELVSTGRCDGKPFHHIHLFITALRTSPKALCVWSGSAGRSKTSGTGLATPSSVRTLTATPIATVSGSWLSCRPRLSTYSAGTVSDRSALA